MGWWQKLSSGHMKSAYPSASHITSKEIFHFREMKCISSKGLESPVLGSERSLFGRKLTDGRSTRVLFSQLRVWLWAFMVLKSGSITCRTMLTQSPQSWLWAMHISPVLSSAPTSNSNFISAKWNYLHFFQTICTFSYFCPLELNVLGMSQSFPPYPSPLVLSNSLPLWKLLWPPSPSSQCWELILRVSIASQDLKH